MGTVVIGGNSYNVYGEFTGTADGYNGSLTIYANGMFGPAVDAWNALGAGTDPQKRTLVAATYWLERMAWEGAKTSGAQVLQWPRTGADYRDGTPVGSATTPAEVIHAAYELAVAVAQNPALQQQALSGSSNIKRLQADVEIEYFRPESGGSFPAQVQDLVGQFLSSGAGAAAGAAYGTDATSEFVDANELTLGSGF